MLNIVTIRFRRVTSEQPGSLAQSDGGVDDEKVQTKTACFAGKSRRIQTKRANST